MSEERKALEGTETHIVQVGVVVKDLDKTVEFLSALGLGPFRITTADHPSATVHGKKVSYKVRLAFSQLGPVQLELIEYVEGTAIQEEYLREKGEGIHHIMFNVQDLDKTVAKFTRKRIEVLLQDRYEGGGGIAYFGTDKIGGIIMEVVQRPRDYTPEKEIKYAKQ